MLMMRDGDVLGVIVVGWAEAGPVAKPQEELLQPFAAQAGIAIEHALVLNELRRRLQQQTATAEVLKVISRSTFDLKAVLDTLIESATRLCDADQGTITRQIDGTFYRAATYGFSAEFAERVKTLPVQLDRSSASGRA